MRLCSRTYKPQISKGEYKLNKYLYFRDTNQQQPVQLSWSRWWRWTSIRTSQRPRTARCRCTGGPGPCCGTSPGGTSGSCSSCWSGKSRWPGCVGWCFPRGWRSSSGGMAYHTWPTALRSPHSWPHYTAGPQTWISAGRHSGDPGELHPDLELKKNWKYFRNSGTEI